MLLIKMLGKCEKFLSCNYKFNIKKLLFIYIKILKFVLFGIEENILL